MIRSTHGLTGGVRVQSMSEETAHFKKLSTVTLAKGDRMETHQVTSAEESGNGLILSFRGVDSKEAATKLIGAEIAVPRRRAAKRLRGEHYVADIVGSVAVRNGREFGRVTGVVSTAAHDLLEIETGEETILVPFVDEFVGRVRPRRGIIEIRPSWDVE